MTFLAPAHAQEVHLCEINYLSSEGQPVSAFEFTTARDSNLIVYAAQSIGPENLKRATEFLWGTGSPPETLPFQVDQFIKSQMNAFASTMTQLGDLQARLKQDDLTFVIIDVDQSHLAQLETFAQQLQDKSFDLVKNKIPRDQATELYLLAAGAPLFLKTSQPDLFKGVEFLGIDLEQAPTTVAAKPEAAAPSAPPRPSPSDARAKADRKRAELEKKFAHNRQTLNTFRRIEAELRSPRTRKLSDAQIRQRAQRRVWRQARADVGAWVDLELKALRAPKAQPAPPPAPAPAEPAKKTVDPLWELLMARHGRGFLAVTSDQIGALQIRLASACFAHYQPDQPLPK
jgi:hypothetical protein